jgi:hypothetical protein
MKMKSLLFALLVAVSTTAFANDAPGLTVVSLKGSDIFRVIYKGASTGKVKFNILDAQGKKIHTQTVNGLDGFILPINFKGLRSGDYTFEVVDNAGTHREKVTFTQVSDMKKIHVSKILSEEGKFLLAVANAQNEDISIKIYDESQRLIYNENKTLAGDFAQVFSVGGNTSGYTFEVSDTNGNRKYFDF